MGSKTKIIRNMRAGMRKSGLRIRRVKPEVVTPEKVLRRALLYKPEAVVLAMIGRDGTVTRAWCSRNGKDKTRLLELIGLAYGLTDELSWGIMQNVQSRLLPIPPRKKPAKKKTAKRARRK